MAASLNLSSGVYTLSQRRQDVHVGIHQVVGSAQLQDADKTLVFYTGIYGLFIGKRVEQVILDSYVANGYPVDAQAKHYWSNVMTSGPAGSHLFCKELKSIAPMQK